MSVSTGARKGTSDNDRISDSLIREEQDFIQRMKPTNVTAATQGPASAGEGTSNAPINDFVETVQAGVEGAINYVQQSLPIDTNEVIHIVRENIDSVFTSFGELTNAVTDGFLDIIDGGDFDGQILKTRIPDTVGKFTVRNRNKPDNTTGDIFMAGVNDLVTQGGEVIEFIFDAFTVPPAFGQPVGGIPGVWRLSGTGGASGSGTGTFTSANLTVSQSTNLAVNDHVEFDNLINDGGIVLQTGTGQANGIFELKAGRTYYLEAGINAQLSSATVLAEVQWWNTTGSVAISEPINVLPINATAGESINTVASATFSPSVDSLVELRISALSGGTITSITNIGTHANIFELGGGDNGGSGGATNLNELTDVTISPNPPTVDGQLLTWNNSSQQWENISPGAQTGATRQLDNLINVAINQDLLPATNAFINLGSLDSTKEWQNLFVRRVRFPVSSSVIPAEVSLANVGDSFVYNAPLNKTHSWQVNGSPQMDLSQDTLFLTSVQLDCQNNSIIDIFNLSLNGGSGDTVIGRISSDVGARQMTLDTTDDGAGLGKMVLRHNLNDMISLNGTIGNETISLNDRLVEDASNINFKTGGDLSIISNEGGNQVINVQPAKIIELQNDSNKVLDIASGEIRAFKDLIMDVGIEIQFSQQTNSATGGLVTPPGNVVGYILARVGGADVRIPYYDP